MVAGGNDFFPGLKTASVSIPASTRSAPQQCRLFVQARMSSTRFPGKVLAPFCGRPLIQHILEQLSALGESVPITVLTSTEISDEPLAVYLQSLGVDVLRGPLDDVAKRFSFAVEKRPCQWFIRLCADSPFPNTPLMIRMLEWASEHSADLLTNTFPRSFAKGRSVEMVRSAAFLRIPWDLASAEDREHVTRYFYRHESKFQIANFLRSPEESFIDDASIDTVEDLKRLEASKL